MFSPGANSKILETTCIAWKLYVKILEIPFYKILVNKMISDYHIQQYQTLLNLIHKAGVYNNVDSTHALINQVGYVITCID